MSKIPFTTDVNTVREHGGTFTPEYDRLIDRRNYEDRITSARNRFITAILDDADDDELTTWYALALAEESTTPVHQATIRNALTQATDPLLKAEIDKTATDNYEHIRDRFNTEAEAFVKAHGIVPATADPGDLALAPEKTRKAWVDGQARARILDDLTPVLLAAARLAGHRGKTIDTLGYVMGAEGIHRRRVWEAWAGENHWTALVELGATIHAVTLDDYQPYTEPAPMETRIVRGDIGIRNEAYDPEDDLVNA